MTAERDDVALAALGLAAPEAAAALDRDPPAAAEVAALAAAAAAPISGLMFLGPHPIVVVLLIMAGLLFWRHAANIARLSAGTEGKIGGGKKADAR